MSIEHSAVVASSERVVQYGSTVSRSNFRRVENRKVGNSVSLAKKQI